MCDYNRDIKVITENVVNIPKLWDGKKSILELKEVDYNWRQMEWWAFYFEYKAREIFNNYFEIPGQRYGNVSFDMKGKINWDLKSTAIKSNNHTVILNDKIAMDLAIKEHEYHGEIIALCDVEYNDNNRSFQKWHTELKGGKSKYEQEREIRTEISRYRKTKAELLEILLIILNEDDLLNLPIMKQGRNSNGTPRKVKYMLELEKLSNFNYLKIKI